MSQKKEECELCDPTADLIERMFCELVSKVGKTEPARCKELMEKKRMKRISYPELLEGLGLDNASFDRHLDVALKRAEKIVKPKRG